VECVLIIASSRYYEGGVSSVYLWDLDDGGFAGVVLLKKSIPCGSWDSIHVFEAAERGRQAHYKLTSTVMLQLTITHGGEGEADRTASTVIGEKKAAADDGWKREGEINLSGSMTRQVRSAAIGSLAQTFHLPFEITDRARLARPRSLIAYRKYR
jgi:hypothetical protein